MNYVRSVDGLHSGQKYVKCPVCKEDLPKDDYNIVNNKEFICSKCSIVYHMECGRNTFCCSKWICKQCAEVCNSKTLDLFIAL